MKMFKYGTETNDVTQPEFLLEKALKGGFCQGPRNSPFILDEYVYTYLTVYLYRNQSFIALALIDWFNVLSLSI